MRNKRSVLNHYKVEVKQSGVRFTEIEIVYVFVYESC